MGGIGHQNMDGSLLLYHAFSTLYKFMEFILRFGGQAVYKSVLGCPWGRQRVVGGAC